MAVLECMSNFEGTYYKKLLDIAYILLVLSLYISKYHFLQLFRLQFR